jgi:hypothetical protein
VTTIATIVGIKIASKVKTANRIVSTLSVVKAITPLLWGVSAATLGYIKHGYGSSASK